MIRVTVELVPFGVEGLKRTIAEAEIGNVGGDLTTGEYDCAFVDDRSDYVLVGNGVIHCRDDSVWSLIRSCLNWPMSRVEKSVHLSGDKESDL